VDESRRDRLTPAEASERLAGKRFVFAAFPLKIRGGTGSFVRAVAILGLGLEEGGISARSGA
jgi:hypothetical protein